MGTTEILNYFKTNPETKFKTNFFKEILKGIIFPKQLKNNQKHDKFIMWNYF